MTLMAVWVIMGLVLLAMAFWHHTRLNHTALLAARRHAEQYNLQLLDQSVVLQQWRVRRSPTGGLMIERRYRFEFSLQGDRRYQGWVTLRSSRVHRVETQPVPDSAQPVESSRRLH